MTEKQRTSSTPPEHLLRSGHGVSGGSGNTASEMAQSVCFNKSKDDVHSGFSTLISDINKQGAPYKLCLANRLYGEKSFDFVK
ncbi:serpin B6-like, partial [Acipenser oxyrinchus oxyrinchus]